MTSTRLTLLESLRDGSGGAWEEMDTIYRPIIHRWLMRYDLQTSDADDLTQNVMGTVSGKIGEFVHNGNVGAFRKWLRTITSNQAKAFFRTGERLPKATGSSSFFEMVEQLDDDASPEAAAFDREHDRSIIIHLMQQVSSDFKESTMQMFHRHVVDGVDAALVADEFEISTPAVYIAKSRVLRKLREIATDWVEESVFL